MNQHVSEVYTDDEFYVTPVTFAVPLIPHKFSTYPVLERARTTFTNTVYHYEGVLAPREEVVERTLDRAEPVYLR